MTHPPEPSLARILWWATPAEQVNPSSLSTACRSSHTTWGPRVRICLKGLLRRVWGKEHRLPQLPRHLGWRVSIHACKSVPSRCLASGRGEAARAAMHAAAPTRVRAPAVFANIKSDKMRLKTHKRSANAAHAHAQTLITTHRGPCCQQPLVRPPLCLQPGPPGSRILCEVAVWASGCTHGAPNLRKIPFQCTAP